MKEKYQIILKKRINLKNLLSKKAQQVFNLQRINIQTITKEKNQNEFNLSKNFFNPKNQKKIEYLNTSLINTNINNNSFYNSNKEPSPISSLNSSPYSTFTKKKGNYKRLQKRRKNKFHNFNINSSNSINNLSLNSKIINTNESVSLSSSCSSSQNEGSDSSDCSFQSRKNRRKKYKELMMAEDDELDYFLKRKEVGLMSTDEEENNNSIDSAMEENYSTDIERILIEIYNNNNSIISSVNDNEINKTKIDIEAFEKQIKKSLKGQNFRTNLLVLKCLSNKIKEIVCKYREKVFEIDEIKTIYEASKSRMQQLRNNHIIHCNNSVGSNVATNSNSSDNSYDNNEEETANNMLLIVQDEDTRKSVAKILLKELINIKKTLKISSKEIENVFKYPLSLLKNEKKKRIKFSLELMQSEEFYKTLLNDEFIYALLSQIKIFYVQSIPNLDQLLEEVLADYDHKNEMTRFVDYINEKLGILNKSEKNVGSDENNLLDGQIVKTSTFSLDTGSSTEGGNFKNPNGAEGDENKNNSKKKSKKKKQKNNENKAENENENKAENEIDLKEIDIDDLLNYINDETDSKKGKKKGKKGRKNKKVNNGAKKENEELNHNENENFCEVNKNEDFDKIFEDFKKDIEKDSVYIYDINKIEPCLSNEFIQNTCSNYLL